MDPYCSGFASSMVFPVHTHRRTHTGLRDRQLELDLQEAVGPARPPTNHIEGRAALGDREGGGSPRRRHLLLWATTDS